MTFSAAPTDLHTKMARWYRHRRGAKKTGLYRQHALLEALALPRPAYPTVHITGTNGKTSTALLTAALLRAHGWRTGVYTSPHLTRVNERIQVDGAVISDTDLSALFDAVDAAALSAARACGEEPTFFELMTALALLHFATIGVDAAVIEVGIGGDTDATNVIDAPVAVIGTVGRDHADQLGNRLVDIAARKAGIIAESATVISGPQPAGVDEVIMARVRRQHAILKRYGHDFRAQITSRTATGQKIEVSSPSGEQVHARLPRLGDHHGVNAALAVAASEAILPTMDYPLSAEVLPLASARGRGEMVSRRRGASVWLDGAHNADASRALTDTLRPRYARGDVVAVVAMMGDKDLATVVETLSTAIGTFVLVPLPHARAVACEELATVVAGCGRTHVHAPDVGEALRIADTTAPVDGAIVVTGSLYLVAEAKRWLAEQGD